MEEKNKIFSILEVEVLETRIAPASAGGPLDAFDPNGGDMHDSGWGR